MNKIIQGDVIETLRSLPDGIVHTCVTSPPYWGLRDYGVPGQIGLEPTPEEYVEKIVEVFREVRRVLRDDGTLWLNLGDSYANSNAGGNRRMSLKSTKGLKPKDLVGIPWRVAFALQADGWYLRSDIIWHKPNAMPESVKDRPTKAHEYIFLLSKSPRYYYDADAILEDASTYTPNTKGRQRNRGGRNDGFTTPIGNVAPKAAGKRNRRTVWSVSTKPFKGAHFAVFPPDLIEPCILAGAPEKACPHCGAPWERVTERKTIDKEGWGPSKKNHREYLGEETIFKKGYGRAGDPIVYTVGWKPTCQCEGNDGSGRGIVLDPFFGSGTTGIVAEKHGRQWIGIELNSEYVEIAKKRLEAGK